MFSAVQLCVHLYNVRSFVPTASPNAPGNLRLVPAAPSLTLEWDRPTNVPDRVPVTYQVEINSTGGSGMNFVNITTLTSLSVHFLEELLTTGQCVMFDFFVRASNDAGTSPLAGIVDTVPICELIQLLPL